MSDSDTEKTEDPTPERLRKAREEGQFPRARDSGAVAASLAVLIYFMAAGPMLNRTWREFSVLCLGQSHFMSGGDPAAIAKKVGYTLLIMALPPAIISAIVAIGIGVAEAGFNPNLDLASPKWERLEPLGKLKQMVSLKETGINSLLSLGRVAIVGIVAWSVAKPAFPALERLAGAEVDAGAKAIVDLAVRLALWASLAMAILAGIEYGKSWWQHRQSMMMSRQELKDEMQQQEGDPRIKARQRARAREIVRRGLRKEVKNADVVVTNPTHIAVAIRYRAEQGAPMVTAKGYDEVAQYIKKIAKQYGIPIIENKPLARTLAEKVRPGRLIPIELYAAVAEVLAFVYRLKHRGISA